jgi:hypothetical protein
MGDNFPFAPKDIVKFIEDIIKVFIPVFQNKDPEGPPVSGGGSSPTNTSSSSGS